jgi:hypothetical protein
VAAPVIQLRVPQDVVDRIDQARGEDTRSAWVLRAIDRELTGQPTTSPAAPSSLGAISPGEPSPGAICATPSCWQRDTRAYGLRRLPLCTACAAAIQGYEYKRQPPPSATRIARRGAA